MSLLDLMRDGVAPLVAYTVPKVHPPVKLDANESPWPLPHEAREVLARALAEVELHRYPDPRATEVREALAARMGGHPDTLVLGSGSDEIISILLTALARPRPGAERAVVLAPTPSFVIYRIAAVTHGLAPVEVPLDERWDLDLDATRAALDAHRPNLVFLATPNNPTGNTFDTGRIRALVEHAPETLFIVDEAYVAFAERSLGSLMAEYGNVGIMGTLSKIGVAAARVGWARLPEALAVEVDKVRQPFNLNTLSQVVARTALTELWPVLSDQVAQIVSERARLVRALEGMEGLAPYPTQANFVLARTHGDPTGPVAELREKGIAIKSFHHAGGRLAGHVRISVGTPEENDRLLEALPVALR